ncbi:MAG: hypothetical protein JWP44_4380 [Mucilaginibacter sp.]|nr:hypothetical protein [Mucilaginibacter sp.]
MKRITLAVLLTFSAVAAQAQSNPAAAGIAGVSVGSKISGAVSLNGAGSSESSALNTQTASATINAVTATNVNAANASFTGTTLQTGSNQVWNYSTGGGSGSASSQGSSTAATLGGANVANIGAGSFAPIGLTGTLTGAGGSLVTIGDNTSVGTNQGQISATQGTSNVGVSLGASTLGGGIVVASNDNANSTNGLTLTSATTGDVNVSAATGNVSLTTGHTTDGTNQPIVTVLGGGANTPTGSGVFVAGASGNGAVIDVSGTNAALSQAIVPGTAALASVLQ